ncbi:hypothetical protein [Leeuwenhoekiella parthenopeia]|uniref:Uncharacterized protein n=1 Tax=Leeuwenhoekiella parthenopeia TaxID=2890320 RepID=A0ABS8GNN1_9FLAO|nr:hypothetical protein [Leeuwenhoekiella parthenopeia]MCC4211376.1 hypothetical protein [Leeuwenhoekiella parthenopeia]
MKRRLIIQAAAMILKDLDSEKANEQSNKNWLRLHSAQDKIKEAIQEVLSTI